MEQVLDAIPVEDHDEYLAEHAPRRTRIIMDEDQDACPIHGAQRVVRYSSTRGADPYAVNELACGHRVACFGPGEANVIL
jgi:hypothetical protein